MRWWDSETWDSAAGARDAARQREVPILLRIGATWCPHTRWQDTQCDDARVVTLLSERFVCVKVDKDRRPDLDRAYAVQGWPTLVWLNHEGEVLARSSALEAEALLWRAAEVDAAWSNGQRTPLPSLVSPSRAPASRAQVQQELSSTLDSSLAATVAQRGIEAYDDVHGGFGRGAKFPRTDLLRLLLARWSAEGDEFALAMVLHSVRSMCNSPLHDRVEGGFHRMAHRPDWSQPSDEKPLATNAEMLLLLAQAHQACGERWLLDAAQSTTRFLLESLLDAKTGSFASCVWGRGAERRVDRTLYADSQAQAVSALLRAEVVLQDPKLGECAQTALSSLLDKLDDERRGVHHSYDTRARLPGRLLDQAYVVRALVDASMADGCNERLACAQRLVALADQQLGLEHGCWADEPLDVFGRAATESRRQTLHDNAIMADAVLALGRYLGRADLESRALRALQAFQGEWLRHGHLAAEYALAVEAAHHNGLVVTIVGERNDDRASAMRRQARLPFVPAVVIRTLDPKCDTELLATSGYLRDLQAPRAYLTCGRSSRATCVDPQKLRALMAHVERG